MGKPRKGPDGSVDINAGWEAELPDANPDSDPEFEWRLQVRNELFDLERRIPGRSNDLWAGSQALTMHIEDPDVRSHDQIRVLEGMIFVVQRSAAYREGLSPQKAGSGAVPKRPEISD